jgi:hypothetical protein
VKKNKKDELTELIVVPGVEARRADMADTKKESVKKWSPGKYGDDLDDIQKKALRGSGPSFSDLIVPLSEDVGEMTDKTSTIPAVVSICASSSFLNLFHVIL